jgi:carboxyl-terminal processing protease
MNFSRYFLVVLLLAGVFWIGFSMGQSSIPAESLVPEVGNKTEGQPAQVDFSIFWRAWNALHEEYIDAGNLNAKDLVFGAIKGMVRAVDDPYTVFLDPQESKNFNDTISGSFEGIGAEIGIREGRLVIIAPLKNTPAERAGLKAGDKVIKIDEVSTDGISLEEAVSRIKGPRGTEVVLTVARDGFEELKDIAITRDRIVIPVLEWELKTPETAYLHLFTFTETVTRKFNQVAGEILQSGATQLVLDLRNNAGGVLDGAIRVAGWFVPQGEQILIEQRGEEKIEHPSPGPAKLGNLKIVVLVNEGSASASEILAGALRDQLGVQLVGAKTFGKGSVQTVRHFPDRSSLKVTIARWLTPSGALIEGEGLEPDVLIEMEPDKIGTEEDSQLQKALELLQ